MSGMSGYDPAGQQERSLIRFGTIIAAQTVPGAGAGHRAVVASRGYGRRCPHRY